MRVLILGLSLNICCGNGFSSNGLLAGGLWVFLSRKNPKTAEYEIASAILDERENRSGASDKARGRGGGNESAR